MAGLGGTDSKVIVSGRPDPLGGPAVAWSDTEALLIDTLDAAPIGVALCGPHGNWIWVNRALARLTGYSPEELVGKRSLVVTRPGEVDPAAAAVDSLLAGRSSEWEAEVPYRHRNGETVWVEVSSRPVIDREDGGVRLVVTLVRDVTDSRDLLLRLTGDAFHDALTGVANRRLLLDRLNHALNRLRRRRDGQVGVFFCDINGFKAVNDAYRHRAGDAVLIEVAKRLTAAVRAEDTVARLGGDEFVILCEAASGRGDMEHLGRRISDAVAEPITYNGIPIGVTLSVGLSVTGDPDADPAGLLEQADEAMYRAKRSALPG